MVISIFNFIIKFIIVILLLDNGFLSNAKLKKWI